MQQKASSRTKAVVGGLLAVGLALTTAVAIAAKGPEGGDYGSAGYGRAYGHRLHCPSYNGMYHSKGRATCHMAPRGSEAGTGEVGSAPEGTAPRSQASQDGARAANASNPSANNSAVRGQSAHPGPQGQAGPPPGVNARHDDDLDDATADDPADGTRDDRANNRGDNAAARGGGNGQGAPKPHPHPEHP